MFVENKFYSLYVCNFMVNVIVLEVYIDLNNKN